MEQSGKARAGYGKQLLEKLSADFGAEYGSCFSVTALKYIRMFYLGYPELLEIRHAVRDESKAGCAMLIGHALRDVSAPSADSPWRPGLLHSGLARTHYCVSEGFEYSGVFVCVFLKLSGQWLVSSWRKKFYSMPASFRNT